jgi:hypothetical protein
MSEKFEYTSFTASKVKIAFLVESPSNGMTSIFDLFDYLQRSLLEVRVGKQLFVICINSRGVREHLHNLEDSIMANIYHVDRKRNNNEFPLSKIFTISLINFIQNIFLETSIWRDLK